MPIRVGAVSAPPGVASSGVGRPNWTNPKAASVHNVPLLQGLPAEKAQRKLNEIHRGAALTEKYPTLPDFREWRDVLWVAPFVLVVAAVAGAAGYYGTWMTSQADTLQINGEALDLDTIAHIVSAGFIAGAVSVVTAVGFAAFAQAAPECVVWTSLVLGPTMLIVAGLALLAVSIVFGLLLIAVGALALGCVFFCYRRFIPFTVQVVRVVTTVMKDHPMMIGVSALGSVAGLAWSICCCLAFAGAYLKYEEELDENSSSGVRYGILFLVSFVFSWGAQVAYNACHVTYCGVYGRWYHHKDTAAPIMDSLKVAVGSSLGSICMGSFLVAAIRALEMVLRQAKRDALEDGNIACCVLLMAVECVVSCIGDLLEYFSDWAYVQCALRGAPFVDAARITYSMMTCANMQYVVNDLLIDSVVSLGALISGAVGSGVGAGVAYSLNGANFVTLAGAVVGLMAGLIAGGSAVGVLSSGAKTFLACWAEDCEPMRQFRPEMHAELEQRVAYRP